MTSAHDRHNSAPYTYRHKFTHDSHHVSTGTELTADHFSSYHFKDVWGGDHEESVRKVHEFFDSEHFVEVRAPTIAQFCLLHSIDNPQ